VLPWLLKIDLFVRTLVGPEVGALKGIDWRGGYDQHSPEYHSGLLSSKPNQPQSLSIAMKSCR